MLWAGCGRLLSVAFLFTLHASLAHLLPAVDYGCYVLLESVTLVLSLLILAGLPAISLRMLRTQLIAGNSAEAAVTVRTSLGIILGNSVLTTLAVSALAFWAQDQGLNGTVWKWLPWILVWATCIALLRMVSELARGYEMLGFSYLIGGQSGGFGVNGILLLAVLTVGMPNGLSLWVTIWMQTTILLLCLVPAMSIILRATAVNRPSELYTPGQPTTGWILRSSIPILFQQLVAFGLPEADTMMLGAFSTGEEIAIYGSARKMVFLATVPLLLVNHAIQPFISEFYVKREINHLETLVRGTATFAGIPCLFVVAMLFLAPELVLRTFFGESYTPAATALRILCVGATMFVMTGSCGLVLTMTGHERIGMWSSLILAVIYLVSAPLLIARFGIVGAAIGTASLQFASNISILLLVYYHERIWTGVTFSVNVLLLCFRMIFPRKQAGGHKT